MGLLSRLGLLGALLALELLAISVWLDTGTLSNRVGLLSLIGEWGPQGISAAVSAVAVAAVLVQVNAGPHVARLSRELVGTPIAFRWLAAHAGVLVAWTGLSRALFAESAGSSDLLAAAWVVVGLTCVAVAGLAFISPGHWLDLFKASRAVWGYAVITAGVTVLLRRFAEALWDPASRLTFSLVKAALTPLVPNLVTDPDRYLLGSDEFAVIITSACSGLEGAGLMLVFGSLWLWFLRHEYRFPRALLLIPAGLAFMWLANIVRIAALFMIGHAGWHGVAAGGFHSQAGWIAFVLIALGFTAGSHRIGWMLRDREKHARPAARNDDVTAYLLPMLAILAAGMIAGALSSGFEWLYPLRVAAAVGALWLMRSHYRTIDWRFGWMAIWAGFLVFGIWLLPDLLAAAPAEPGPPPGLQALPPAAALAWVVLRTLGGVVTVPIAEELAFRGYLMRRLVTSDFARVSFERVPWMPILVSSVAFGVLHGSHIVPAMLAGLIYAAVVRRSGRIGDAIVAHATTNGLIAVAVLLGGQWRLW